MEQQNRLMMDLAGLGQKNPVTQGLNKTLLTSLLRGDSASSASSLTPEVNVFGLLRTEPEKGLTASQVMHDEDEGEEEEDRWKVPRIQFDGTLLDLYRELIENVYEFCAGGSHPNDVPLSPSKRFPKGSGTRVIRKRRAPMGRAALNIVLSQLLSEQDIVLHRALLHNQLFDQPGPSGKKRKNKRRSSSIAWMMPEQLGEFSTSLTQLVERSLQERSLLGLLIAVKALLCVYDAAAKDEVNLRGVGEEGSRFLEDLLCKTLPQIGAVEIPSQWTVMNVVSQLFELESLRILGAAGPLEELRQVQTRVASGSLASLSSAVTIKSTLAEGDPTDPDTLLRALHSLYVESSNYQKHIQYGAPVETSALHVDSPTDVQPSPSLSTTSSADNQHQQGVRRKSFRGKKKRRPSNAPVDQQQQQQQQQQRVERRAEASSGTTPEMPGCTLSHIVGRPAEIDQESFEVSVPAFLDLESLQDTSVEHADFRCDGCTDPGVLVGMRFQCAQCEGYDLCFSCFQQSKNHDSNHLFWLYPKPRGERILLPARQSPRFSVVGAASTRVKPFIHGEGEGEENWRYAIDNRTLPSVVYFEVTITQPMHGLRLGWARVGPVLETNLGDNPHSWAVDVDRSIKVHDSQESPFPVAPPVETSADKLLQPGDTVGCWIDRRRGEIGFSFNGVQKGVAFSVPKDCGPIYPCVSFTTLYSFEDPSRVSASPKQVETHQDAQTDTKNESDKDDDDDDDEDSDQQSASSSIGTSKPVMPSLFFNAGNKPFKGIPPDLAQTQDLAGVRNAALCSTLCVPRTEGSGAKLIEDTRFINAIRINYDYTLEAIIFWDPPQYRTKKSVKNQYVIFSRFRPPAEPQTPSLSSSSSSLASSAFGIVGDGYLYLTRQESDSVHFTKHAVIVPRRWTHVSVTFVSTGYRSQSVYFVVDGATIKAEARKKTSAGLNPSSSSSSREADPFRISRRAPPSSASSSQPIFDTTSGQDIHGCWAFGGELVFTPEEEQEQEQQQQPPQDSHERRFGRQHHRKRMKLEIRNSLSGYMAEIRVWKRELSARELLPLRGRLVTLDDRLESHLLLRFRADEAPGQPQLFLSSDACLSSANITAQLCGEAVLGDISAIFPALSEAFLLDSPEQEHEQQEGFEDEHPKPNNSPTVAADILQAAAETPDDSTATPKQKLEKTLLTLLGNQVRLAERYEAFLSTEQSGQGIGINMSPPACSISPHVLNFLLLHSILRQAIVFMDESRLQAMIVIACLKLLRVNLSALKQQGLHPASVGLGPSPDKESSSNVGKLRRLLLSALDGSSKCGKDLKSAMEREILVTISSAFDIFYPTAPEQRFVLTSLVSLVQSGPSPLRRMTSGDDLKKPKGNYLAEVGVLPRRAEMRWKFFMTLSEYLSRDLELLESIFLSDMESRAGQSSKKTPSMDSELKWSVDFVLASLSGKQSRVTEAAAAIAANANVTSENTLTKRLVIRYMQQVAPETWLKEQKLDQNEAIVTKMYTSEKIKELYSELAQLAASGQLQQVSSDAAHIDDEIDDSQGFDQALPSTPPTADDRNEIADYGVEDRGGPGERKNGTQNLSTEDSDEKSNAGFLFATSLLSTIFCKEPRYESEHALSAAVNLLQKVQQVLSGAPRNAAAQPRPANLSSTSIKNSLPSPLLEAHLLRSASYTGKVLAGRHGRSESVISLTPPSPSLFIQEPEEEEEKVQRWWEESAESEALWKAALQSVSVSTGPVRLDPDHCSRYLSISSDGATCIHQKHKHWGSVLGDQGFSRSTGIHRWQVDVLQCNIKGHFMIGVATRSCRLDSYLGNDKRSFGIVLSGDLYTDAHAKRKGAFPKGIFGSGMTIEVVLNTDTNTISISDETNHLIAQGELEFELPDLYAESSNGQIFPAICTYEQSDSARFVANLNTRIKGHWLLDHRALKEDWGADVLATQARTFFKYTKELFDILVPCIQSVQLNVLESVLRGPLAALLLLPRYEGKWLDDILPGAIEVLNFTLGLTRRRGSVSRPSSNSISGHSVGDSGTSGAVMEVQVLLCVFIGKLCATLVTSRDTLLLESSEGKSREAMKNNVGATDTSKDEVEGALSKWCSATLLSRGFVPTGCLFARNTSFAVPHMHEDKHMSRQEELPAVVDGMIKGTGTGNHLFEWMNRHYAAQNPANLLAYGSSDLQKAVNGVVAALLYHSGWLGVAFRLSESLGQYCSSTSLQGRKDTRFHPYPSVRPDDRLVEIWQKATEMKAWLVRYEKDSDGSANVVSRRVLEAVSFLLDLKPCCLLEESDSMEVVENFRSSIGLAPAITTQSDWERPSAGTEWKAIGGGRLSPLPFHSTSSKLTRSRLFRAKNKPPPTFSSSMNQVLSLIREVVSGELSIQKLHQRILARQEAARRRALGFRTLASVLQKIPLSVSSTSLHCALLSVVPSALRHWTGGAIDTTTSWHYLNGLESSSAELLGSVTEGFESFGHALTELLHATSAANQSRSTGLQLSILDSWGIRLEPVDHELLSRTNLFETLHRIMDSARDQLANETEGEFSSSSHPSSSSSSSSSFALEQDKSKIIEQRLLGRAAMKLFYLLCSQVATSPPHAFVEKLSYKPSTGYSLMRMRSGPESLNSSVFNILFQEIRVAADQVLGSLQLQEGGGSDDDEDASIFEEAKLHLQEITQLLLSICSSPASSQRLSAEPWLSLFCSLAKHGPSIVRSNAFRLFRMLVPQLKPESVKINFDGFEDLPSFLLALVADALTLANEDETASQALVAGTSLFPVACEAAATLRLLFHHRVWGPLVATLLQNSFSRARVCLEDTEWDHQTLEPSSSDEGDGDAEQGGQLTVDEDDYEEDGEPSRESVFSHALAGLAVLSGSLVKLFPGTPVYVVHVDDPLCRDIGEVDILSKPTVHLQQTLNVLLGASGKNAASAVSAQLLPRLDFMDWAPDAAGESLVQTVLDFASACLEISPFQKSACSTTYRISGGPQTHLVFNRMGAGGQSDSSSPEKIGSYELGMNVSVSKRVGNWAKLDVSHAKEFDNEEAWMILQDSDDDYHLSPTMEDASAVRLAQAQVSISFALQAVLASARQPTFMETLSGVLLKDTSSPFQFAKLLDFALEETPEVLVSDLHLLDERLSVVLEELSVAIGTRKSTKEEDLKPTSDKDSPAPTAASTETDGDDSSRGNVQANGSSETDQQPPSTPPTNESHRQPRSSQPARQTSSLRGQSYEFSLGVMQITEMGFPRRWAEYALRHTGDVTSAITYICSHGETLDERIIAQENEAATAGQSSFGFATSASRLGEEEVVHIEVGSDGVTMEMLDASGIDIEAQGSSVQSGQSQEAVQLQGEQEEEEEEEEEDAMTESDLEEDKDFMEVDGVDSGHAESILLSPSLADNRAPDAMIPAESQDRNGTARNAKTVVRSFSLPSAATKVLDLALKRVWGPCADSRTSYIELLSSYSLSELYEELFFVARTVSILRVRILLLFFLSQVTEHSDSLSALLLIAKTETAVSDAIIQFVVNEGFASYPFYACSLLKMICTGCGHEDTFSLPRCLEMFVRAWVRVDESVASSVLKSIGEHIKVAVSADFVIDKHLGGSSESTTLSLWFVDWATRLLLDIENNDTIQYELFSIWVSALKSPSVLIKREAMSTLAKFLDNTLQTGDPSQLSRMIQLLPWKRLHAFASRLVWRDLDEKYGPSKFTKTLVSFCAKLQECQRVLRDKVPTFVRPSIRKLHLGSRGFVDLRDVNGQQLSALKAPWTVSFWVKKDGGGQSDPRKRRVLWSCSSTSDAKSSRNKSVDLLAETRAGGHVGFRLKGQQEQSLGYVLPEEQWTVLTFVCQRLPQAVIEKAVNRPASLPSKSGIDEDQGEGDGEESEADSERSMSEDEEDSLIDGYTFDEETTGLEAYFQFLDLARLMKRSGPDRETRRKNIEDWKQGTTRDAFIKLYANDKLVGSCKVWEGDANLPLSLIGTQRGTSFSGDIERVALWSKALQDSEIGQLAGDHALSSSDWQSIEQNGIDGAPSVIRSLYYLWDFTVQDPGTLVVENVGCRVVGVLQGDCQLETEVGTQGTGDKSCIREARLRDDSTSPLVDSAVFDLSDEPETPDHSGLCSPGGLSFSGVLTWDLEDVDISRRLLIPNDFYSAFQSVHLDLRCPDSSGKLVGVLTLRDTQSVSCQLEGDFEKETGKVHCHVSDTIGCTRDSRRWLSKLHLSGYLKAGEFCGEWRTDLTLQVLPELKDSPGVMRFVPRLTPVFVNLQEDAQEVHIGVDIGRLQGSLPPFVLSTLSTAISEWVVLVLETSGFPFQDSKEDTEEGGQDEGGDGSDHAAQAPSVWSCPVCTLTNSMDFPQCEVCQTPNPNLPSDDQSTGDGSPNDVLPYRGVLEANTGTYFWEFQIGIKPKSESSVIAFGVCCEMTPLYRKPGSDEMSWCVFSNGDKCHDDCYVDQFLPPMSDGDIVGLELDTDAKTLRFLVNGHDYGIAFSSRNSLLDQDVPLCPFVGLRTRDNRSVRALGLKNGWDSITYEDEEDEFETFEGFWKNGRRHGLGTLTLRHGNGTQVGFWEDGRREGVFCSVDKNGKKSFTKYIKGEKVSQSPGKSEVAAFEVLWETPKKANDDREKNVEEQGEEPKRRNKCESQVLSLGGSFSVATQHTFVLDPSTAGPGVQVSRDCLSATYTSTGGSSGKRCFVLGSRGFSSGKHYWEVKVQSLQWGSTYIGISERVTQSELGTGWGNGYGFVNYRATHGPEGEQLYGSFYAVGDVVGVLLDMDRGRLHFFKDSKDFQTGNKQVIVDLGLAYSRIRSKFSSSGKSPTFYPCIGFSKIRDAVSLAGTRSFSVHSLPPQVRLRDYVETIEAVKLWDALAANKSFSGSAHVCQALVAEALCAYKRWHGENDFSRKRVYWTLGNTPVEISLSKEVCIALSPSGAPLFPGVRLRTERGDVEILGTHRNCIWYRVVGVEQVLFWSPSEIAELIAAGKADVLNSSSIPSPNEDLPQVKLTEDVVRAAMNEVSWTFSDDTLLVQLVNRSCDTLSCEPEQLPLRSLLKTIHKARSQEGVNFSSLTKFPDETILGRFLLLLVLNIRFRRLFTVVDLSNGSPGQVKYHSEFVRKRNRKCSHVGEDLALSESLGEMVGRLRGVIFTRVKLSHWEDKLQLTTTPTIPAADEYDPPPGFPHVKINRIQAGSHRLLGLSPKERLKRSVFGQLMLDAGLGSWNSASLRRSYSHIQDASQKRCFFVKLVSEGVDDHGGPYRAVFQIAIEEEAAGPLKLLVPCPNASEGALENMDKLIFSLVPEEVDATSTAVGTDSPSEDSTVGDSGGARSRLQGGGTDSKNSSSIENASGSAECVHFLGRLVGVAIRHEIHVGLSLPGLIWKPLVGLQVGWKELHEIDSFTARSLRQIEMLSAEEWEASKSAWSELLLDKLENTEGVRSCVDESGEIPFDKRCEVIDLVVEQYLMQYSKLLESFAQGLSEAVPVDCFLMFSPHELETLVCGGPELDINLLRRATVYEEVDPDAEYIRFFWEALGDMSQEERAKFINFVSARSRLPSSLDKFPMMFKITPPPCAEHGDQILPKAQTCFFSLSLPVYSSKQVCLERLLYAANNCNTMEDYQETDAVGFQTLQ